MLKNFGGYLCKVLESMTLLQLAVYIMGVLVRTARYPPETLLIVNRIKTTVAYDFVSVISAPDIAERHFSIRCAIRSWYRSNIHIYYMPPTKKPINNQQPKNKQQQEQQANKWPVSLTEHAEKVPLARQLVQIVRHAVRMREATRASASAALIGS